jgi:putative oxidoreductase
MRGIFGIHPGWGLTLVRLSMGLIFTAHGYQKLMGGMAGVAGYFAKVGVPMPELMAPVIATVELVGGILLILGLATRWVGLVLALEMVVTGFWVQMPTKGWNASELDRILLAAGLMLFLAGPGRAAVDKLWLEKGE